MRNKGSNIKLIDFKMLTLHALSQIIIFLKLHLDTEWSILYSTRKLYTPRKQIWYSNMSENVGEIIKNMICSV